MNTAMNLAESATKSLLLSFRKGATASFKVQDYVDVLACVPGWDIKVTKGEGKASRTIVSVVVTAPSGASVTEVKEPGRKWLTMYDAEQLMREEGLREAVSQVLGLPSYEEEQADKKMYGVANDLSNAGTCPCCFSVQKLDDGVMVLHGYQRPGDGYTHGRCYGVGRKPLEVSSEGVVAKLEKLTRPSLEATVANQTKFLAMDKATMSINKERQTYQGGKLVTEVVTLTAKDGYKFDQAYDAKVYAFENAVKTLTRQVRGAEALIANWVPDISPLERREAKVSAKMIKYIMPCM